MRKQEFDWRISATSRIFHALSDAIKDVEKNFDEAQEEYERDTALENVESLLGIAFVTAQTYITGVISDVNILNKGGEKVVKEILIRSYNESLSGSNITQIELCDAIANYFKHHDEWSDWLSTPRNQKTISVLQAVGIKQSDEFPCRKAADILWSHNDSGDLTPLLNLIADWRGKIISTYIK